VSGCNRVPIVRSSSGYCGGHWDYKCLSSDVVSYNAALGRITRVSLGSLHDQGYTVDYTKASFTAADLGANCTCPSTRRLRAKPREQPQSLLDVPHGATAQLGMPSNDNEAPHRRLSDSGHQAAVGLGRSILAQRATTMSSHARRRLEDSGVVYVGDKVVSVLMMEDGQVFSVVVKP
jgi:hypothetical protein